MTPPAEARKKVFTLTMTEDEHQTLLRVAEADDRSAADWIRAQIRASEQHERTRAVAAWEKLYEHHRRIIKDPTILDTGVPPGLLAALVELESLAKAKKDEHVEKATREYKLAVGAGRKHLLPRFYDGLAVHMSGWLQQ